MAAAPGRAGDPGGALETLVITAPGLEAIALGELAELGIAAAVVDPGALSAELTARDLYRANLHLRSVSRLAPRIGEGRASGFGDLEALARRVPWARYLPAGARVRLRVTCRKSRLYHSGAVAERVLEAIARAVPGVTTAGGGDEDDAGGDEQLVLVRLLHDRLTLRVDSSGELLHRRGYRLATSRAPLRETLAAAMLLGAGWSGATSLIDPMCGSGTLVIEAALLARRIAPGLDRRFAFERWPAHDAALWREVRAAAQAQALPAAGVALTGSDRDPGAIVAARANAERAGVLGDLTLAVQPLSALAMPGPAGLVITNPPYGVRIGDRGPLRDLYAQLGNLLRARPPGWTLALLAADATLERQLRLPLTERWRTTNGGLPIRLLGTP